MKKSIGIGIIETEIVAIFLSRDKTRDVNFTKNIVNKLEIFATSNQSLHRTRE